MRAGLFLTLIALALASGAGASAQPPAETPRRDTRLRTGFTPDPIQLSGAARGQRPLNDIAAGCRGFVGDEPDQVLRLDTRFGFLRLFVVASQEVTLALRGPDGEWRCRAPALEGAPRIEGVFEPGRWEVWIGSVERDRQVAYELSLTEFHSITPLSSGAEGAGAISGGTEVGLSVDTVEGRFRARRLRRGFLPDPREDEGTSGGSVDTRLLGGNCRGFVDARPSHVLRLCDDFDYFRVQLAGATGRTSLLVRTPGGRFFCHAPDEGDARIGRDEWPQGDYRIWVGSLEPSITPEYQICYTETRPTEGRRLVCGQAGPRGVARTPTAPDECRDPPEEEDGCAVSSAGGRAAEGAGGLLLALILGWARRRRGGNVRR